MGYRYIGTEPLWYVKDGLANILFYGDWVPSDDVEFMVDNHLVRLDDIPGEGPTGPSEMGSNQPGPTGPQGPVGPTGPAGEGGTGGTGGSGYPSGLSVSGLYTTDPDDLSNGKYICYDNEQLSVYLENFNSYEIYVFQHMEINDRVVVTNPVTGYFRVYSITDAVYEEDGILSCDVTVDSHGNMDSGESVLISVIKSATPAQPRTTYYLSTSTKTDPYSEGDFDYSLIKTNPGNFMSEKLFVEVSSDYYQDDLEDFYTLPGDLQAGVIPAGTWQFSVTSTDDPDPNYMLGDDDYWGFIVYLLTPGEGYDWTELFTTMCSNRITTGTHTYEWVYEGPEITIPEGGILCAELLITTSDDHDDRRYYIECAGWQASKIEAPIPFRPYGGSKAGDIMLGDSLAKNCVGTRLVADPVSSSWGVGLYPSSSNLIGLFNGTEWVVCSYNNNWFYGNTGAPTLDLDGNPVVANAVYDVFASLSRGDIDGYLLFGKKWATTTSRGYSLSSFDGVPIGPDYWEDRNKRYVGTVYTIEDGSYIKFCDTNDQRFVYSYYNQREKLIKSRFAPASAINNIAYEPFPGWLEYGPKLVSPGTLQPSLPFSAEVMFSFVAPNGDPLGRVSVTLGEANVSSPYMLYTSNNQNPNVAGDCAYQQSLTFDVEFQDGLCQPVPLILVDGSNSGAIGFTEMVIHYKG
jgi:hypothetical protein